MLDLAKNNPAEIEEAGYEFEVLLPNKSPTGAFIKVRGTASPMVKAFARKKWNETQIREKANKRRGKEEDFTIEDAEAFSAESAAVRVISWKGIAENGVELEATPENIKSVMTRYPFIRDQVLEESNDVDNFRYGND